MSDVFNSIVAGLNEAIKDATSEKKVLKRNTVSIIPLKVYSSDEIKRIRMSIGMSQSTFAGYMGVSGKTVEAWESGKNHPSGTACRLLNLMEMDKEFTEKYTFVKRA